MADCEEIEAGHAQKQGKGRERYWKDEEIEMLITLYEERPFLWDVGHKDYMNRDNLYMGLSFGFLHLRRPNVRGEIVMNKFYLFSLLKIRDPSVVILFSFQVTGCCSSSLAVTDTCCSV